MTRNIKWFECLLLTVVIIFGIALRVSNLDCPALWEDEAESSINALTILQYGYPVDSYLGFPIYENTLVKPWPESEKYEFRDISYSDKGVAVYHGWLPLYSIAASLWWFGITPDKGIETPRVLYGRDEASLRTIAPRIPAVVFSLIFLVALFFFAKSVHSRDTAWAAVTIAAVADNLVYFGRNARYYSATLALVTLCALVIWRLTERQGWRDFALAAIALVGLFHTHMLSFVVMSLVFVAASFRFRRAGRIVQQLVLFATTVAAGTVPWVLLSGFLHTASRAPKGWPLLDFPADLIRYIDNRLVLLLVVAVGLGLLTIFALKRRGRPRHMIGPYVRQRMGVLFLIFWSVGGFLAFVILTPAASFFEDRLSLMTAVPGLILFCAALVTVSQVIAPRHSWLLTMLLAMGIFTVTGRISLAGLETRTLESPFLDFIDRIKDWEFEPHTHIYADPNRHLILTYYSGLPVQSIAPVRKSFLNNTIDDVIIIETTSADSPLPIEHIVKEAKRASVDLSRSQAWQLMRDLDVALVSRRLQGRVAAQWPPVRELTPLERTLAQAQTALTRDQIVELKRSAPIFRGYDFQNWREWWAVFFYRFSGVEDRWRENLNFNDRIRDATAWVFPWGWVLYDCSRDGSSVLDSNMDRGVFD